MEGPQQLAAADIEAPDVADRRGPLAPPVEHGGADHDDTAHDHRRRGHGVEMRRRRPPQTEVEIDAAVGPEIRDGRSGPGVERNHLRKRGQDHDALVATPTPIGDAAVGPADIGRRPEPVLVDLGVEQPFGLAGRGIDGGNLRQRGRGVEHAIDHQRRRFIDKARTDLRLGVADNSVGRFPAPHHAQVLGVVAIDLRERRVARGGVGAGVSRPLALRQGSCGFRQSAGDGLGVEVGG